MKLTNTQYNHALKDAFNRYSDDEEVIDAITWLYCEHDFTEEQEDSFQEMKNDVLRTGLPCAERYMVTRQK